VSILLNQDFSPEGVVIISKILVAFMFVHLVSLEEFSDCYVSTMRILCVYSLVATYVLRYVLDAYELVPMVLNWEGTPFYDFGLTYVIGWLGFVRNFGIFREPGVYQFYITIALALELFFFKRTNRVNVLIFLLTMLSTFSVVGIAQALVLVAMSLVNNKVKRDILAPTLIVIGGTVVFGHLNRAFTRTLLLGLEKVTTMDGAMGVRYLGIVSALQAWLEKPFFGHGPNHGLVVVITEYMDQVTVHLTGTLTIMLVTLGIVVALSCCWCLISLVLKSHQKGVSSFVLLAVILTSISSQNLVYNDILWVLLFLPFSRERRLDITNVLKEIKG